MKKIFNLILIVLYFIGLIAVIGVSGSRMCFYLSWPRRDDFVLLTLVIIYFFVHYLLVYLGYKAKYLVPSVLHMFKITEIVYTFISVALIVFLNILFLFHVPFGAIFPTLFIPAIALVLRKASNYIMGEAG